MQLKVLSVLALLFYSVQVGRTELLYDQTGVPHISSSTLEEAFHDIGCSQAQRYGPAVITMAVLVSGNAGAILPPDDLALDSVLKNNPPLLANFVPLRLAFSDTDLPSTPGSEVRISDIDKTIRLMGIANTRELLQLSKREKLFLTEWVSGFNNCWSAVRSDFTKDFPWLDTLQLSDYQLTVRDLIRRSNYFVGWTNILTVQQALTLAKSSSINQPLKIPHRDYAGASNQWVFSPNSSQAFAIGDPHISFPLSDFSFTIQPLHVETPEVSFSGGLFLGTPAPLMGVSYTSQDSVSYTTTSAGIDSMDFYLVRVSRNKSRFASISTGRRFTKITSKRYGLTVNGESKIFRVRRTSHGSIIRFLGDRALTVRQVQDFAPASFASLTVRLASQATGYKSFMKAISSKSDRGALTPFPLNFMGIAQSGATLTPFYLLYGRNHLRGKRGKPILNKSFLNVVSAGRKSSLWFPSALPLSKHPQSTNIGEFAANCNAGPHKVDPALDPRNFPLSLVGSHDLSDALQSTYRQIAAQTYAAQNLNSPINDPLELMKEMLTDNHDIFWDTVVQIISSTLELHPSAAALASISPAATKPSLADWIFSLSVISAQTGLRAEKESLEATLMDLLIYKLSSDPICKQNSACNTIFWGVRPSAVDVIANEDEALEIVSLLNQALLFYYEFFEEAPYSAVHLFPLVDEQADLFLLPSSGSSSSLHTISGSAYHENLAELVEPVSRGQAFPFIVHHQVGVTPKVSFAYPSSTTMKLSTPNNLLAERFLQPAAERFSPLNY